jgi:hypothetical protein
MHFINYFLIIYFINLCTSFTSFTSFTLFKRPYYMNKFNLNMGCDYYIDKDLHIYDHNINIQQEKGYYYFFSLLDEDEDDYANEFDQYK